MVVIDRESKVVTQINVLTVLPEHQSELARRMDVQVLDVMSKQPGFISSTIHCSRDGSRVINYVQWATEAELDAAHEAPDFKAHYATYRQLVEDAGPRIYVIASSSARPSNTSLP